MAANVQALELYTPVEELLAHLPVSHITEYGKGHLIYGRNTVAKCIYLLVAGKVVISQIAPDRSEVLLEVVRPAELFGESGILDVPRRSERATAIEKASVMAWPISDMGGLVMKQPRLAVVLLQTLARRNAEFTRRIESFAVDNTEQRLARSLIRFSERLGTPEEDGGVLMMPFTHEMLARYVGTSREIVTHHMTKFRKRGYVSYSRQGIRLYRDTLKTVFEMSTFCSDKTVANAS
jgi:CRP/FNR family transcriptional regulator